MSPLVFSIRPAYVAMFRAGTKRAEFRTRCPSAMPGSTVLIYETLPVGKIVAEARVNNIMDDTPAVIWDQVGDAGGITRTEFDQYFAGRSRAVAIWLSVRWLDVPVPLPDGMAPPQSWARLKGTWPIV